MKQVTTAYFQVFTTCPLQQKYTNPGFKFARVAKFYIMVLYVFGSSLSNVDHVTILRFLPDFGKYVQHWFKIIVPFQVTLLNTLNKHVDITNELNVPK